MAEADRSIDMGSATLSIPLAEAPDAAARRGRWRRRALMLSVPLVIAGVGCWLWITSGRFVSTDNAYVKQDIVSVGADVNGRVVAVGVRENQMVKAGDLLFRVDPDPYRVALAEADAAIAGAQVKLDQLRTDYATTDADIDSARSDVVLAQQEFDRQQLLMAKGFTTKARLQQAENALQVAQAELRNKIGNAQKAQVALASGSQVPGVNPAIAAAQAARAKAALSLTRTEVRAPVNGRVSQASRLQVGNMMIVGMPALSIVAEQHSWIEANFKESQLDHMYPGQSATVTVDAYPGMKLKGHVESIGAGTGSQFSLLPAQNANGNWIKVTQRVPVRIAIDDKSPRPLLAGLSADVSVDVRRHGSN
ncbi:MAG: HlyD family secretion protein [Sphingobium sp.]